MKLPRSLNINGKRWRVVLKPLARRGMLGQCLHAKREIQIDQDIPTTERQEVFLHEVIHACLPERWSMGREEKIVFRLSPRLLNALQGIGWAP